MLRTALLATALILFFGSCQKENISEQVVITPPPNPILGEYSAVDYYRYQSMSGTPSSYADTFYFDFVVTEIDSVRIFIEVGEGSSLPSSEFTRHWNSPESLGYDTGGGVINYLSYFIDEESIEWTYNPTPGHNTMNWHNIIAVKK